VRYQLFWVRAPTPIPIPNLMSTTSSPDQCFLVVPLDNVPVRVLANPEVHARAMIEEIRRATAPHLNRERKAQSTARIKPTASAAGSIRDNFGSNPDERKRFKPWLPSVHTELPPSAPISRSLPGSLQLLLPEIPSWTVNPIPETCQLCTQNSDRAGSRRPRPCAHASKIAASSPVQAATPKVNRKRRKGRQA